MGTAVTATARVLVESLPNYNRTTDRRVAKACSAE
jgi:hypothetical protein